MFRGAHRSSSSRSVRRAGALGGSAAGFVSHRFPIEMHRGGGVIRRDAAKGGTPLVTASSRNNGITKRVNLEPKFDASWITVCSNGSVGEVFVRPEPFVATADVTILEPKSPMPVPVRHFICTVIRHEHHRFNYGRKWPLARMAESEIRLPNSNEDRPDLEAMARYVETLRSVSSAELAFEPHDELKLARRMAARRPNPRRCQPVPPATKAVSA